MDASLLLIFGMECSSQSKWELLQSECCRGSCVKGGKRHKHNLLPEEDTPASLHLGGDERNLNPHLQMNVRNSRREILG